MGYLWLCFAFTANGIATLLLKHASQSMRSDMALIPQALTSPSLIIGLFLFATNVIFYFLALRALSLSVAYPIMVGMTFVFVAAGSTLIFKESISIVQYFGFAFIIAGLTLATIR